MKQCRRSSEPDRAGLFLKLVCICLCGGIINLTCVHIENLNFKTSRLFINSRYGLRMLVLTDWPNNNDQKRWRGSEARAQCTGSGMSACVEKGKRLVCWVSHLKNVK